MNEMAEWVFDIKTGTQESIDYFIRIYQFIKKIDSLKFKDLFN